jgi:hypothetical protein
MKLIIYLFTFLTFAGCAAHREKSIYKYQLSEIKSFSEKYSDSLILSGVDTMIHYFNGCAACMCGITDVAYIYWVKNGEAEFIEFNNTTYVVKKRNKKLLRTIFIPKKLGVRESQSIAFLDSFGRIMKNEIFESDSSNYKNFRLNYQFETMKIKIGESYISYSIADYIKASNLSKTRILFINRFLSDIYDETLEAMIRARSVEK